MDDAIPHWVDDNFNSFELFFYHDEAGTYAFRAVDDPSKIPAGADAVVSVLFAAPFSNSSLENCFRGIVILTDKAPEIGEGTPLQSVLCVVYFFISECR